MSIGFPSPYEILKFWFVNEQKDEYRNFWFDRSADTYITLHYSSLLYKLEEKGDIFKEWTSTPQSILATIIVLDQFSRTIYRGTPEIYKNDKTSFELSQYLIKIGYDLEVSLSKRIFILMPYRHQKDSDLLDIVLQKIEEYSSCSSSSLLARFKTATLMNYTYLTDRIEKSVCQKQFFIHDYRDVLDEKVNEEDVDKQYYIEKLLSIDKYPLYKTLLSFVKKLENKTIGVSLSGGVDSMVILFLLKIMKTKGLIDDVYALHLEYCNRQESSRETEMIQMFCGKGGIDVELFIRRIDYMSRESTDRTFYEEETRKIRFATYRYLSDRYNVSGWCLGHHHGDISENVLMNVFNGRDLLDLSVMKQTSQIDGVNIYRPLLEHPKSDIFEVAKEYMIPYTKDTTPDWSCRGVLRRKLLPVMEEQWPMIYNTLTEIGRQSDEWGNVIEKLVLQPIKKNIQCDKEERIIEFYLEDSYKNLPKVVWTNLFLYMFHSISVHMISRKNVNYFLETYNKTLKSKIVLCFQMAVLEFL